jgi:hypothetical protein
MNQQKLNSYFLKNFECDRCEEEYHNETAYSPAPSLEEINDYRTYCSNCVIVEKEPKEKTKPETKKKKKSLGLAPIHETTENIRSLEIDKRTLTKTGRTYQLGTRVKKEFLEQLKAIAYEERLKLVEVLEKALACYSKHREK